MFAKSSNYPKNPDKILLCHPQFFEVVDEKNVHMKGQIGKINKDKALLQWESLVLAYQKIVEQGGLTEVSVLKGEMGLEDMVFAANQTFPFLNAQGEKKVILSNMKHPNRMKEVPYYQRFFEMKGYSMLHLPDHLLFEGMGDLLPIPQTRKALCGFGFRTSKTTVDELKGLTGLDIIALELVNPDFYHLDTCIVPLNESMVLYAPSAFSEASQALIKQQFSQCIAVPEQEASQGFALNMHVVSQGEEQWALLQKGNKETEKILSYLNIKAIPVDTSEFIKSGGSVFCLKMMYY